ncbi:MAG: IS1634 family transposase [bacterium]|nr:IS1634 family transposase [bacterium]
MYIDIVPNRHSPPAVLLREGWRENGKVRKRTVANLSSWPLEKVETLRRLLKNEPLVGRDEAFDIVRSLPHGHVAAVLGTLKKLGLDRLIDPKPSPRRNQVLAMIAARILEPASKLATARGLAEATAVSTLGEILEAGLDEDDLYDAMDWLLERQERIERSLARRHLEEGSLVLYDMTSVWMEGTRCPLARRGHSRDGRKGTLQITFGLLCNRDGCPVSVEVFPGNTADPNTVGSQVAAVRQRFSLARVVLVGDRGMLTAARIREEVKPSGLDWISALRGPAIRALVEAGDVEMSLFDERDLVEITSDAYPGERLMVCRNPLLAEDRARKRSELLEATEALLEPIAAATRRDRRRLKGREKIGERVGKVIGKYKMAKHIAWSIDDDGVLTWWRDEASISAEARLDGLYVIRTSLPASELDGPGTVRAYKRLSSVERAFRSLKTVDLKVRPVFHRTEPRVRAHVFLCMLAYYVEWHMRQKLKPVLFDDEDAEGAEARRPSVVAPAAVSPSARAKKAAKTTPDGDPVHSLRTLLDDLATITRNTVAPRLPGAEPFQVTTRPTPLQMRILDHLGVRP